MFSKMNLFSSRAKRVSLISTITFFITLVRFVMQAMQLGPGLQTFLHTHRRAGTGKTFIVQSIADILGVKLVVINLNQQVRSRTCP